MPSLFIVDVPEYRPMWECAEAEPGVEARHRGAYVELSFDDELRLDRRATGVRHAVWYSGVGGLRGATVVQFDKDALRLVVTPPAPSAP
jgi:hypothetical protein